MPLYKSITVSSSIKVYIWKIVESESVLSEGIVLTEHCQNRMDGMKSEIHRKGFLSIRHLLAEHGYVDADLEYDSIGKPHLKDGKFISITHSNQFTGIIIGDTQEVGIDIEMQRNKIERIAHKFTPVEEYKSITDTTDLIRKFTIVWGCKEALYKIYAQPGLSFLKNINVRNFSLSDKGTTGKVIYNESVTDFNIDFLEFEGFTCVYAVKC